jgi:hypothetical protein
MYTFSTGLPDDRVHRITLYHVTTPTASTSDRNTKWWVILIADNFMTNHPQITLHTVTSQEFTLFYTEIFLIQSFSNHKLGYKKILFPQVVLLKLRTPT